jgi:hypothetical protein
MTWHTGGSSSESISIKSSLRLCAKFSASPKEKTPKSSPASSTTRTRVALILPLTRASVMLFTSNAKLSNRRWKCKPERERHARTGDPHRAEKRGGGSSPASGSAYRLSSVVDHPLRHKVRLALAQRECAREINMGSLHFVAGPNDGARTEIRKLSLAADVINWSLLVFERRHPKVIRVMRIILRPVDVRHRIATSKARSDAKRHRKHRRKTNYGPPSHSHAER